MNLPNKLTLSRILAVLVITVLYFVFKDAIWNIYLIAGLFLLASFTDFLDGKIARKYNLVTGFGKLMDPLADKLLVIALIIILIDLGSIPYIWLLLIVIARELLVLGVRLVALEQDKSNVIAADFFGKAKTMTQMVSLTILILHYGISLFVENTFTTVIYYVGLVLFYISMVLLVISGTEIFVKNKKYFTTK